MSIPDNWLFADEEDAELVFVLLFPVVCCRRLQEGLVGVANTPAALSILVDQVWVSILLVVHQIQILRRSAHS